MRLLGLLVCRFCGNI